MEMSAVKGIKKSDIISAILAIVHLIITFVSDRFVFDMSALSGNNSFAVMDYTICKLSTLAVLFLFYRFLYILLIDKSHVHDKTVDYVRNILPYALVALLVLVIKLPAGFISNDENAIYNNAITLTHDTWFYYITVYYYIVSLMLIPFKYAPIIIKVIIQLLTVAYVVTRAKEYFGRKIGNWSYLLFLMYPVIAYTTSAHRLPIYFLLYLTLFAKMLFDGLEGKCLNIGSTIAIVIAGAVLTQWRTEGIYLLAIVPILIFIAYKDIRSIKKITTFVLIWLAVQYIVSVPQNGLVATGLDDAANDRMKPFYAYTITNMYRNGLDLEKNASDLAIVDKYISLESIKAINEYYCDINYEDVLILYQDGFVGVRQEATVADFIEYSDAVKRIFINNPDVFLKTRWGAFCYAARPYHITFTGFGIRNLISFGISIIKTFFYNLFIPVGICLALCIFSLFTRRWYSFFTFGGLMAHWFIVFILAPASYFKYYFPLYIMAYFYLLIMIMWKYLRRKGSDIKNPLW